MYCIFQAFESGIYKQLMENEIIKVKSHYLDDENRMDLDFYWKVGNPLLLTILGCCLIFRRLE